MRGGQLVVWGEEVSIGPLSGLNKCNSLAFEGKMETGD